MKPRPRNIDEYFAGAQPGQRAMLQKLRHAVQAVAPGVEQHFRYGIAAFHRDGQPLVYLGARVNGCSFYPLSAAMAKTFRDQLESFTICKGVIRFTPPQPLSVVLMKRLVKARIAENTSR